MLIRSFVIFLFLPFAGNGQNKILIQFLPADSNFQTAADEYHLIWQQYGDKIVEILEKKSGLKFIDSSITATIYEGISMSGYRKTGMKLRASYDMETKKGTLIHELGHRIFFSLNMNKEYEDHPLLFLFLYDAWVDLFGKTFADSQVEKESKRKGYYDYEKTWKEVLTLSSEERSRRLNTEIKRIGLRK